MTTPNAPASESNHAQQAWTRAVPRADRDLCDSSPRLVSQPAGKTVWGKSRGSALTEARRIERPEVVRPGQRLDMVVISGEANGDGLALVAGGRPGRV